MTLEEWMVGAGLNDEQLSIKLGRRLSRSQINRIKRGRCKPSIETARLLETVTTIPASAYVMGEAAPARRKAA
jgi:transcriptional regulator with XRE-family HTH domain